MDISSFIAETAIEAGKIVVSHFGHVKNRHSKGDRGDIVTEADFESERHILDRIRKEFPDHNILSEEAGKLGDTEGAYTWLIDPLDGTRNYASGIPFFSVSIALVKNGGAECGAVYDPLHDELFAAAKGQGATLNGVPIQVSGENELEDAVISISWLRRRTERSEFVAYVDRISHSTSYFRRLGSAALISAYVAAGRVDAYMQGAINCWDIAAGTLLVAEAGGVSTDFHGKPIDLRKPYMDILAANPVLHQRIVEDIIKSGAQP